MGSIQDIAAQGQNKSVFSFLRQLSTWHCPHLLSRPRAAAAQLLADRYLLPTGLSAANPPHAVVAVDRRTETGPLYKPCSASYVKGSPYSITEHRVPELIPVLGSQPAGDVSHKPGVRLPLLSARPAVTIATLKRAATNFAAW